MLKLKWQNVAGVVCCFLLFILMFVLCRFILSYGYSLRGHINPGLLIFILPGVIASLLSPYGRVSQPLFGALLAVIPCMLMIQLWCIQESSLWQDLAFMFGAVFWSTLGALGTLFVLARLKRRRLSHIWL